MVSCSSATNQETIEYTCKTGKKIKCPKNKCDDYCRKYDSYDDSNYVRSTGDSDNPFQLDQVEEQVEFGHGN